MRSEYSAHLSLVEDAEDKQGKIKAKNMETIESEKQRKREVNAAFWHSIKWAVLAIVLAAIALYTLIKIAG